MNILIYIILFTINFLNISRCREVYQSQDKTRVISILEDLNNKEVLSKDELCYKSVFECMKADYVMNPYQKLSYFNKGYNSLNTLIDENKSNVEYRYHRYMIEKHAPSWLIEDDHTQIDKEYIIMNITKKQPMYSFIMDTINN
tara:strand:+ start:24449 stop:24877 length:429 start_codon:yes stop_codon:yes gene_type:complete